MGQGLDPSPHNSRNGSSNSNGHGRGLLVVGSLLLEGLCKLMNAILHVVEEESLIVAIPHL